MPVASTPTHALADLSVDVSLASVARGDLLYRGATQWNNLAVGSAGKVLLSDGTDPVWSAQSGVDHGSLGGLMDDDHAQYARLAGRAGGQTLIGGTAASENLTLQSTAHATRGKILFGTSGYDEVNNRFGIGTGSPAYPLDVVTDAGGRMKAATQAGNAIWIAVTQGAVAGAGSPAGVGGVAEYTFYDNTALAQRLISVLSLAPGARYNGILNYSDRDGGRLPWRLYTSDTTGTPALAVHVEAGQTAGHSAKVIFGNATTPQAHLQLYQKDAATNSITEAVMLSHNTTGTPAAGFGSTLRWQLQSSTTIDQSALAQDVSWVVATHASRTARVVWSVFDTAAREAFRIEASGSAAMFGVLGAAAIPRYSSTGDLRQLLIDFGFLTTGGASPLNLNGGMLTGGEGVLSKRFTAGVVALTDAATVATDAALGSEFTLSTGNSRTLGAPTNAVSGQRVIWRVKNTSGGAVTLTLDTGAGGFRFGSDITALSATAAGKADYLGAVYDAGDSKWDVVSYVKGF